MPCYVYAAEEPKGEFDMKTAVLERFLNYIAYDTQSDPDSNTTPSTSKQMIFARYLYEECKTIGLSEIELNEYGIVTATLPANIEDDVPVIGFLAHMDTSPEFSGKDVVPQIIENYDGKDIVLNAETVLSPEEFPALRNYIGQTIITTSGDTLLGADNKAGIAIILTAMEYLIQHSEIPRGKIRIAFTPDEEIGRGTDNFDVDAFGADFAFTVDGGPLGDLEFENFNAARALLEITGRSVHPGSAKGIMKNSVLIAAEIASAFPPDEVPAKTEGYEGFYHLVRIDGDVAKTRMEIIIRCFDRKKFEARKEFVVNLVNSFNRKYGEKTVKLDINDQYYNMKEKIDPHIIEYAKAAFSTAGVEANIVPVRGGTDGAMLSYKGLPCPNIFTGGHNFHGPYEFISVESMVKAAYVIINLAVVN
jgi:tripeptide aminopeptidase